MLPENQEARIHLGISQMCKKNAFLTRTWKKELLQQCCRAEERRSGSTEQKPNRDGSALKMGIIYWHLHQSLSGTGDPGCPAQPGNAKRGRCCCGAEFGVLHRGRVGSFRIPVIKEQLRTFASTWLNLASLLMLGTLIWYSTKQTSAKGMPIPPVVTFTTLGSAVFWQGLAHKTDSSVTDRKEAWERDLALKSPLDNML